MAYSLPEKDGASKETSFFTFSSYHQKAVLTPLLTATRSTAFLIRQCNAEAYFTSFPPCLIMDSAPEVMGMNAQGSTSIDTSDNQIGRNARQALRNSINNSQSSTILFIIFFSILVLAIVAMVLGVVLTMELSREANQLGQEGVSGMIFLDRS
ncbi:hypothetical protein EV356DRAFT_89997 [Viridothelium virens]|uniref:Uncharacterized protein n=1 Tax=Viridothelium virens TaxID=1048519 RepID=A0A6A6HCT3_VIRVR|nr:hypothetical protein EV356DRAFT_89997 [Viridothelium virens]